MVATVKGHNSVKDLSNEKLEGLQRKIAELAEERRIMDEERRSINERIDGEARKRQS